MATTPPEGRSPLRLLGPAVVETGLTSLGSVATTLVAARWLPVEGYATYALALTLSLAVHGALTAAFVAEPVAFLGPSTFGSSWGGYVRAVGRWTVLVALAGSVVLLGIAVVARNDDVVRQATLLAAVWGPGLAVLTVARRLLYAHGALGRGVVAAAGYATLNVAGALALVAAGRATPGSLLALQAVVSAAVAVLALAPDAARGPGVRLGTVGRSHASYGRWVVVGTLIFPLAAQMQVLLVAVWSGPAEAARYAAALVLVQPAYLVLLAAVTSVQPAATRMWAAGDPLAADRLVRRSWRWLAAGLVLYAAALALGAAAVDRLLFGGRYELGALLPLLALLPLVLLPGFRAAVLLRASGDTLVHALPSLAGLVPAVVVAALAVPALGANGGLASLLAAYAAGLAAVVLLDRRKRPLATALAEVTASSLTADPGDAAPPAGSATASSG